MIDGFDSVCSYLPERIRESLLLLPLKRKDSIQEIRLYAGSPLRLRSYGNNIYVGLSGKEVSRDNGLSLSDGEMEQLFYRLCDYSVYSCEENLKNGFVTLSGGHRAGLCGTAVVREDKVCSVRDIRGMVLRISGDFQGGSLPVFDAFSRGGQSAVIFSPPGGGKTTVLRDLGRRIAATGDNVSVIDERGEISAWGKYDLCGCDLLLGYPKAQGILQAVRTLSPKMILCDEIGSPEEAEGVSKGFHSGVGFVVTVHAKTAEEAVLRPGMKRLLSFFDLAVFLRGSADPGKVDKILPMKEILSFIPEVHSENSRKGDLVAL